MHSKRAIAVAVLAFLAEQIAPSLAENRIPAGGAFMNSCTSDPYYDPKSLYSQTHSLGDVGGQTMLAEPPGFPKPCSLFDKLCADRFERRRVHAYGADYGR